MKILHVATNDISGGAARAAYRLHVGLRRLNTESFMLVANRSSNDPHVTTFTPSKGLPKRLHRHLRSLLMKLDFARYRKLRPSGYEQFSNDRSQYSSEPLRKLPSCDVINLHWIANFIDYKFFIPQAAKSTPIVWTLHDMNVFTGGCHYDDNCRKYYESCGKCSQLGSNKKNDLSHKIWCNKQKVFSIIPKERLSIVANSYWLAAEARSSSLLSKFPIKTIHYGIDVEIFAPRDRLLARSAFGVPQDAKVILFVADLVTNRRKGFTVLLEALKKINNIKKLFLVSVGSEKLTINLSIPHLCLGHIENDRLLSLAYSASDVFVIPSLQEAFGQTALEAMACGVPVVGFDTGGIPDMIRPGITGLLVPPKDVSVLQAAMVQLLQNPEKQRMIADNCRRIAVEEFSLEVQAQRYIQLYNEILEGNIQHDFPKMV